MFTETSCYRVAHFHQVLNYSPASWRVPYDHMIYKDSKQALVSHSLQLLLVLVVYPIPEEGRGPSPKNYFRHFLGRLHRLQDFQFIVDGMTKTLNQPVCFSSRQIINELIYVVASHLFVSAGQPKGVQVGSRDDHALLGNPTVQSAFQIVRHRQ